MFNRIKDGMYWDRAWKLVEGCTPVSEGCAHCWSARETHMRAKNPNAAIAERNKGLTSKYLGKLGVYTRSPFFNGKIRLRVDNLALPIRTKKPMVWAIWNDPFHEDVPEDFIGDAIHYMDISRNHIFMVLTKRPEIALRYFKRSRNDLREYPHVWLGVTAENQDLADKRIPILLQIPAAKRYVSIEPMLGPILLPTSSLSPQSSLDWVICGGESGPGARPMHPDWARSLRDQCAAARVPFFFKQFGEWSANYAGYPRAKEDFLIRHKVGHPSCLKVWRVGKAAAGRILDGKEWLEVPKI